MFIDKGGKINEKTDNIGLINIYIINRMRIRTGQ